MHNNNLSKYSDIGRKIREVPQEKPVTSYEWEELVQKLSTSNDAVLHEIGIRELYEMLQKRSTYGGMKP